VGGPARQATKPEKRSRINNYTRGRDQTKFSWKNRVSPVLRQEKKERDQEEGRKKNPPTNISFVHGDGAS